MNARSLRFGLASLIALLAATMCAIPLAQGYGPGHGGGGHGAGAFETEFVVLFQFGPEKEQQTVQARVKLPSKDKPADLDQEVQMPGDMPAIRLKKFLPKAELEQNVVPDETGRGNSAIQLAIEGKKQSLQRWIVAGDPVRNRLVSLIGSWRYAAVKGKKERNKLFERYKTQFTRDPELIVSLPEGGDSRTLPLAIGKVRDLSKLGCKIRVKSFFPHFVIDKETKKPSNRSDKRLNPAALVEITHDGATEERWVFGQFPDYDKGKTTRLPIRVVLDCPIKPTRKTPDFVLVSTGGNKNEVWTRDEKDRATSKKLETEEKIDVPGSPYTFHVVAHVPSALLIEKYVPSEKRTATAALKVETADKGGATASTWVAGRGARRLMVGDQPVSARFGLRPVTRPSSRPATRRAVPTPPPAERPLWE